LLAAGGYFYGQSQRMSILQITYNDIINRMRAKEWKWKDEREREKRNVMNQLVFRPLFRMRAGAGAGLKRYGK